MMRPRFSLTRPANWPVGRGSVIDRGGAPFSGIALRGFRRSSQFDEFLCSGGAEFLFYVAVGIGAFGSWFWVVAPFGLETHWDKSGPFRYVTTDSRLSHIEFLPTAVWSVNDKLSVGGSVGYFRTSARLSSALNVTGMNDSFGVPSTEADGGKTVEGDGDAWGYVVSSLLAITEKDTVGLTYRSRLKTKVEGTTRLSGLAGASASVFGGADYSVDTNTELIFPDTLTLGFARRMGKITFALDAEYAGYGAVKETKLSFKGESDETRLSVLNDGNPVKRDWRNSWNMGTGVNAVLTPTLEVRGGYLYYPTVIPEENWDPSIPGSRDARVQPWGHVESGDG